MDDRGAPLHMQDARVDTSPLNKTTNGTNVVTSNEEETSCAPGSPQIFTLRSFLERGVFSSPDQFGPAGVLVVVAFWWETLIWEAGSVSQPRFIPIVFLCLIFEE